jgi:hypothetical protein
VIKEEMDIVKISLSSIYSVSLFCNGITNRNGRIRCSSRRIIPCN